MGIRSGNVVIAGVPPHSAYAPKPPHLAHRAPSWVAQEPRSARKRYLPGELERAVADFVEHYNHRRYHESLLNWPKNPDDGQ